MIQVDEMAFQGDSITVFDLDDTLVVTSAKIQVTDTQTGEVYQLTPQEFNEYEHKPHHSISYNQFEDPQILKAGQLIERVLKILKSTYENETAVAIVTARNKGEMIRDFFLEHDIDIHPKFVIAVNDPKEGFTGSVAQKKQQAFRRLYEMGYKNFRFFDDDINNLTLAKELEKELPISVRTHQITSKHREVKPNKQEIGIFSGKFKPPHLGHYESILKIADQNSETYVFVSSKPEDGITGQMAVTILNLYFQDRDDIHIVLSQQTPVRSAYEFVEELGKSPGSSNIKINLYALPADMVRFAAMEKWLGHIPKVERHFTDRPEFTKSTDKTNDSDGVSGTIMRDFIKAGDFKSFTQGIPKNVDSAQVWQIVTGRRVNENKAVHSPGAYAVPADSFNQADDPNMEPTQINVPVGGLPSHWTTTQPYSRFDLKTNPFADRYGMNPKTRTVKSFDDFCKQANESDTDLSANIELNK